jgi:hypothetical protein
MYIIMGGIESQIEEDNEQTILLKKHKYTEEDNEQTIQAPNTANPPGAAIAVNIYAAQDELDVALLHSHIHTEWGVGSGLSCHFLSLGWQHGNYIHAEFAKGRKKKTLPSRQSALPRGLFQGP